MPAISPAVMSTIGRLFGGLGAKVAPMASGAGVRGAIAAGARGAVRQLPGAIAGGAVMGAIPAMMGARAYGGGRRRRGRGITAAELRGARKIANLVRMYGMRPKSGRVGGRRRKC